MFRNIADIINSGEGTFIEFKKSFNKESIIAISSFANTKGGYLLVGVDDNGEIIGLNYEKEIIQQYINQIKNSTYPHIIPEVLEKKIDDKTILVFKVSENPIKPVSYKNRYYKRVNNSNHIMSLEEIVNLQQQTLNISYDSYTINDRISILNDDLIQKFMDKVKKYNRFNILDNNFLNLTKMKLIREGKLTIASKILFTNSDYSIHIGRFRNAITIVDDKLINKPLMEAVEEAMIFLKKHISIELKIENELERKEVWQYPLVVIRELLLNSVVHRDYQSPSDVIIKIFDNKIIFSNPGNLYGGLTLDDIKSDYYSSSLRNKLIADTFFLLGDIEKYGTGFTRIRNILKKYENEIKLNFREMGNSFIVELISSDNNVTDEDENVTDKNENVTNENGNVTDEDKNVTDEDKNARFLKIVEFLKNDSKISVKKLAIKCDVNKRTILRDLDKLKESHKIIRIGNSKSGYWEVL